MVQPPISELRPDYTKSTEKIHVYYDTAVKIIKMEGNLKLLGVCELCEMSDIEFLTAKDDIFRKFLPNLPSWVPNWAVSRTCNELWGGYRTHLASIPFTGSDVSPSCYASPFFGRHGIIDDAEQILEGKKVISPSGRERPYMYSLKNRLKSHAKFTSRLRPALNRNALKM